MARLQRGLERIVYAIGLYRGVTQTCQAQYSAFSCTVADMTLEQPR